MKTNNEKKKFQINIGGGEAKRNFFENFATMLTSGVNITDVLDGLYAETTNKKTKNLIGKVRDDVSNGKPLWRSLEENKVLPANLITLVKFGEESGNLKENLEVVINQQTKDREFKSKLRSASLYPSFVLVLMSIVGSVVGVFVLPRLSTVYGSLNVELPLITRVLIVLGEFLGKYGLIVIPSLFIFLGLLFFIVFIFSRTKVIGQKILFNAPIFKNLIKEIELARFGYLLGTLLQKGFPILDSLKLLESGGSFYNYKKLYHHLYISIEKGDSFAKAFNSFPKVNNLIPLYPRQLIITGEKSGKLAESLIKVNEIYEKKNDITTKNLNTLFEPVLLILVWIGVAFIALAVILPIYSLIGDITSLSGQTTGTPAGN